MQFPCIARQKKENDGYRWLPATMADRSSARLCAVGNLASLSRVDGLLDHAPQPLRVSQCNRAAPTHDKASALQRLELARNGLSARTDACGDFRMHGRWRY